MNNFSMLIKIYYLTACTDQLLYNLSLIAKQNTSVNARDACSLLPKQKLFDLVGRSPNSLVINFDQFIKSFLV